MSTLRTTVFWNWLTFYMPLSGQYNTVCKILISEETLFLLYNSLHLNENYLCHVHHSYYS